MGAIVKKPIVISDKQFIRGIETRRCYDPILPRVEDYKPALPVGTGVGIYAGNDVMSIVEKVETELGARYGSLDNPAEQLFHVYDELGRAGRCRSNIRNWRSYV